MLDALETTSRSSAELVRGNIAGTGTGRELTPEPTEPVAVRYRVTFKHRTNEAEPPRSEEFAARGPSAAKAEALRRSRDNEIMVDLVPLG